MGYFLVKEIVNGCYINYWYGKKDLIVIACLVIITYLLMNRWNYYCINEQLYEPISEFSPSLELFYYWINLKFLSFDCFYLNWFFFILIFQNPHLILAWMEINHLVYEETTLPTAIFEFKAPFDKTESEFWILNIETINLLNIKHWKEIYEYLNLNAEHIYTVW